MNDVGISDALLVFATTFFTRGVAQLVHTAPLIGYPLNLHHNCLDNAVYLFLHTCFQGLLSVHIKVKEFNMEVSSSLQSF